MNKIAVVWTSSYDNIMFCREGLKKGFSLSTDNCVKANYKIDDLKKETGWSGLNISYNLALLWEKSVLFSSIWNDFEFSSFLKNNLDLSKVYVNTQKLTSRYYFTTDKNWTELNSEYLWEIWEDYKFSFEDKSDINYWVISSFYPQIMIRWLDSFKQAGIKTIFNPGNKIKDFSKSELELSFKNTHILVVNEEEYEIAKRVSEKSDEEMISSFENIIITYWINWSKVFDKNYNMVEIPGVSNPNFKDSVWVWEAYIAWLLKWLNNSYNIEKSARLWAVIASISTWSIWAQNHKLTWDELKGLYNDTFWEEL